MNDTAIAVIIVVIICILAFLFAIGIALKNRSRISNDTHIDPDPMPLVQIVDDPVDFVGGNDVDDTRTDIHQRQTSIPKPLRGASMSINTHRSDVDPSVIAAYRNGHIDTNVHGHTIIHGGRVPSLSDSDDPDPDSTPTRVLENIPTRFIQVSTLTNDVIQTVPVNKFVWTEKIDGVRVEVLIENGIMYDITNPKKITIIKSGIVNDHCFKRSILETEHYEDKYIIFDVLMIENESTLNNFYIDRITKGKEFVKNVSSTLSIFKINDYRNVVSWEELLEFINNHISPYTKYRIDGAICYRTDMPYYPPSNQFGIFKLKLPSMNTIDFYIRYVEQEHCYYLYLYGSDYLYRTNCRRFPRNNKYMIQHTGNDPRRTLPDNSYILFSSPFFNNVSKMTPRTEWNSNGYLEPFKKVASEIMDDMLRNPMKYDGKIIEMSLAQDGWVPFRIRDDKIISNSYYVGYQNMTVLFNPIDVHITNYFAGTDELTSSDSTINVYHKCSHVLRQYLFETVIGGMKEKILTDNRLEYDMRRSGATSMTPMGQPKAQALYDNDDETAVEYVDEWNADEWNELDYDHHISGGSIDDIFKITNHAPSITTPSSIPNTFNDVSSPIPPKRFDIKVITHKPSDQISLLDIACGRGSDIITYCNLGITNLFAVDPDRSALLRYAFKRINVLHTTRWKPLLSTTKVDIHDDVLLNVIPYMLSQNDAPLEKLIRQRYEFPANGFDIIVMNYAFHYLCYSHRCVCALRDLVASLLNKVHGRFIVTYADGDKILSLMKGNKVLDINPFKLELVDADDEFKGDSDMILIRMPLPTIDSTGYRIEPLVTQTYLKDFDDKLKLVDEFYLCDAADEYLKVIEYHQIATNYLGFFKARVYERRY